MFSPQTRRYFEQAQGYGQLDHPTHESVVGKREHGHFFQLQLETDANGVVTNLAFDCPRCVPAIACGGYLYLRLVRRGSDQTITVEQVVDALGGLPPQRCFYAWMAVEAFNTLRGVGER
ncbi:MAG: iron-sulfur cluster assembly scaffold protein [Candidatus Eremiobacteraeota bacterium]|nr:iron-sulfur cluster assembly scaffold protein [Candidatus Eremiobacteraeota bacterium]MCW5871076.1 iron-sulfur cluster assembly scaffold protein [Candidatus Eremiobacteraeota bacterium]